MTPRPPTSGRVVDLRSDTVTTPTPQMREAMARAEVGDDVFGEDPTVNRLQEQVAAACGKAAALFVPSGSMGNLISLRTLTQPGDEVICHEDAHLLHYEAGSLAAVAGLQPRPLPGRRGVLDPAAIAEAIHPTAYFRPRTRVIALENTHNLGGGAVYPIDEIRGARKVADEHELGLYLDGARVFNASVATGIPVSEYCSLVDAMSFSFSKGLAAPVGSIVVGSEPFIREAHRYRKMYGGAMRQAGVLAAACLVALDTMVERLAEDHTNAKRLAEGIAAVREGAVAVEEVQTNMVLVRAAALGFTGPELTEALELAGVRALEHQAGMVRMVTHKDVSSDDIGYVVEQVAGLAR